MRLDAPGPYSLDALKAMPRPVLFNTDAANWRSTLTGWFEQETGRTLYPAQVETLLIETLAYAMGLLGEEAAATAAQHLVAFADDAGLGLLGVNRSTARLKPAFARCSMRFSIASVRAASVTIAAGTRVGSGSAVFRTLAPVVIAAGQLSVTTTVEAVEAGIGGNGFLPGQITALLDPIGGVVAANTTASEGGADIEPIEAYRVRVANAFERISTGGSQAWYRETALGVSPAIVDVAIVRPQPCYVDIYPLTLTGAAGVSLRALVQAAFDAASILDIRFGDLVTVKAPVAVAANPVIAVRVRGAGSTIAADASVVAEDVLNGWRQRLGSTIAPSELEAAIRQLTGVVDAEVSGLAFQQLSPSQFLAASAAVINVTVLP
jgi:phage-related baseplate assembly protein